MRLFGIPVHVMLVHFPIALWPAHWVLHLSAHYLPQGAAVHVGFWLLVAGTLFGWCAATAGAFDLAELLNRNEPRQRDALLHASINGLVLAGFTTLGAIEYSQHLSVAHSPLFLASEAFLLIFMIAGNHFGGRIVWAHNANLNDRT